MAIEWPDDQLSVFATLRGALFAIGDEELLEYPPARRGRFHPFRVPEIAAAQPAADSRGARAAARRCTRSATACPSPTRSRRCSSAPARTSGSCCVPAASRRWPTCCTSRSWRGSTSSTAGCRSAASSRRCRPRRRRGQAAEAPILEEGSDGVRLMTVHKAKGLEFPVVILADITARLTPYEAGRHIDPRRQLCALRIGGWSPKDLNDSAETRAGARAGGRGARRLRGGDARARSAGGARRRRRAVRRGLGRAAERGDLSARGRTPQSRAGARCPAFKSKDSVLERPDGDPASMLTVCPGAHQPGAGGAQPIRWSGGRPDDAVARRAGARSACGATT